LHDLGVTLHFKDSRDIALKNIVILKPEWATEAFYKILSTKSVLQRGGLLLHSDLEQIWDQEIYPSEIHPQLMELMNKFELAYELPNKSGYLVAELLSKSAPDYQWGETDDLCFYYSYDYFLPAGIITRFIVRMHQNIEKKEDDMPLCWRDGAVLTLQTSHALVEMNSDDRLIKIKIKDENERNKRWALGAICSQLDQINATIKNINVTKQIPCNCSKNCTKRYSYDDLLKFEMNNIVTFPCFQSSKMVTVLSLLDGYTRKEERIIEYNEKYGNTYVSYGEMKVSNDNIHIHDVVGSVNVKARLDHVTQTVYNAPALEDTKKQELSALIEELKKALEPAASINPDDTDRVIEEAERVAKEVSREKPSKSRLESIADDLKETAKAVAEVAPAVLPIAAKIAMFVTGLH
jgi:internalin A